MPTAARENFAAYLNAHDLGFYENLIRQSSARDFERALNAPGPILAFEDFCALLSSHGRADIEALAQKARAVTRKRFGHTAGLYAPLYLSNYCVSSCLYCGFNAGNPIERKRLTLDEIEREAAALSGSGIRHILLVAGTDPKLFDDNLLYRAVELCHRKFASVSIEIEPLDEAAYRRLGEQGLDGLVVYQETYDRSIYAPLHPAGPKKDFDARLVVPEEGANAGLRRVGLGVLLGLAPWEKDVIALALHLKFMIKKHWRTLFTLSLPRFRAAGGVGYQARHPVDDLTFTQILCALRLLLPDTPVYLSTREPAHLRDGLLQCAVTHISAGSKTSPGAYTACKDTHTAAAAAQFEIEDRRSPAEIGAALKNLGIDPVWKDWEGTLNDRN